MCVFIYISIRFSFVFYFETEISNTLWPLCIDTIYTAVWCMTDVSSTSTHNNATANWYRSKNERHHPKAFFVVDSWKCVLSALITSSCLPSSVSCRWLPVTMWSLWLCPLPRKNLLLPFRRHTKNLKLLLATSVIIALLQAVTALPAAPMLLGPTTGPVPTWAPLLIPLPLPPVILRPVTTATAIIAIFHHAKWLFAVLILQFICCTIMLFSVATRTNTVLVTSSIDYVYRTHSKTSTYLAPTVHYKFVSQNEIVSSSYTVPTFSANGEVWLSSSYVEELTTTFIESLVTTQVTEYSPTLSLPGLPSFTCSAGVTSLYSTANTFANLCQSLEPLSSCTTTITNNFSEQFCLWFVPVTTTYLGVSISYYISP